MKKNMNTDFNIKDINKQVKLYGWVSKKRNLGGVIFIDLRDRSGIIQLIINPENSCYNIAQSLKSEYVIKANGTIKERENKNKNIPTGDIEVNISDIEIINKSEELPFEITDNTNASEETRLKYRYLDIRRTPIKNNLILRHKIMLSARNFFDKNNFIEIETPILGKSTPEGARDYLVPSRINKGSFYALPQSPQVYKQLLMVAGIERYFQIAKCFRDEDLRADRQPEFTQIDVEMSFVDEDDVMTLGEQFIKTIFKDTINYDVKLPLMRMKYDTAIDEYGSDKPDLRFDMKIKNITSIFNNTFIEYIKNIITNNGVVNAIVVKNASDKYSRKDLDKLSEFVKTYKANFLTYLKVEEDITGSLKNLSEEEKQSLKDLLKLEKNDLILIVSGEYKIVKTSLGALRCKIARDLNLIDKDDYKLLWVTDFPSFEWSEEENRYTACHHPFTAVKDEDIDKLLTDKANCYSKAYDIVINGYEAGGGSIRIHNEEIQAKMFEALGLTMEVARDKFGFFMSAFKYGAPSHGGFACGLDRLTMLLSKTDNIKDVIAFPKTTSASCLMSDCPNKVDDSQLKILGISTNKVNNEN